MRTINPAWSYRAEYWPSTRASKIKSPLTGRWKKCPLSVTYPKSVFRQKSVFGFARRTSLFSETVAEAGSFSHFIRPINSLPDEGESMANAAGWKTFSPHNAAPVSVRIRAVNWRRLVPCMEMLLLDAVSAKSKILDFAPDLDTKYLPLNLAVRRGFMMFLFGV